MSNEATIRSSLQIRVEENGLVVLDYRAQPTSYQADVSSVVGPTPGSFLVSTAGTDVDLSALTIPGLCRFMNNSSSNYVTIGIWDPEGVKFFPMLELLPGEFQDVRLARDIQEEYADGSGTGTDGANTNRLRFKAIGAACNVTVDAFEK
jgi:hypothetical protein